MTTRPSLEVGALLPRSRANGPGIRAVVWVQGCSIGCPGCINQHLLHYGSGHRVDPVALGRRLVEESPEAEGLTISGGEPFEQADACTYLLATAQILGWSTMVYTGFQLRDLRLRGDPWIDRMLARVDLLIDGPYRADQRAELLWRGSSNQRIHCLSDRYRDLDLESLDSPTEEVIYELDRGRIVRTGLLSKLRLGS